MRRDLIANIAQVPGIGMYALDVLFTRFLLALERGDGKFGHDQVASVVASKNANDLSRYIFEDLSIRRRLPDQAKALGTCNEESSERTNIGLLRNLGASFRLR